MPDMIQVQRFDGQTFEAELLPLRNGKEALCRECNAPIRFAKTPRGSNMPVSEKDGKWHAHHNVCANPKPRPKKPWQAQPAAAEQAVDPLDF